MADGQSNPYVLRLEACEKELALMRRLLDLQTPLVEMALGWIAQDQREKLDTEKRLGINETRTT